jgi:hypothetical protein
MELLGMRIEREEDGWVVMRDEADRHRLAFQRVLNLRAPNGHPFCLCWG